MKTSFSSIFWSLISLGVGCFFLVGAWGAYRDNNRTQGYSGRAIGKITKKHFQTTADGGGNYYVEYWFVPTDSYKINGTNFISKQQWDALKINDKLEIRYDPLNHTRNIPLYGSSPLLVFAFFMLILGTVFIVFGISRFYSSFNKR